MTSRRSFLKKARRGQRGGDCSRRHLDRTETAMTTIRTLAAIAGLLVLSSCTGVKDMRLSSPVLPMQEPAHAAQAPVLKLGDILHVGAAATPPINALPLVVRHGSASVHHGELPNTVTRTELVAYLHEEAHSYLRTDAEAGIDVQLFPDGLLLRFAADPPLFRVAESTSPQLLGEAVLVVQLLNMALPRDWQIKFGDEAGTADLAPSEITIAFAVQEDWPAEFRPPEGEDIGLAMPRYEFYATADLDRPFNIEITGGQIWIDPTRTAGDERLGVIAHEIIHILGREHPDPAQFPDSIMVAGGGDGPTEYILHPLDRAALFAVYSRVDPGGTSNPIDIDLGPWADTSTHLYGIHALSEGEVTFGTAFSNGLVQPWASGTGPDTALAENPRLAGTARWSGRLLGLTPAAEAVAGGTHLAVQLATMDGEMVFTGLEYWPTGTPPGAVGTGSMWLDSDLGYRIEVRGNTFVQTGGDVGAVTGAFFGPAHEGMGGVILRDDLSAAFGGTR